MPMDRDKLPVWVVERCVLATRAGSHQKVQIEWALAEFLAIIEERGLRIVPVPRPASTNGLSVDLPEFLRAIADQVEPVAPRNALLAREVADILGAPPLAELLEDRDAD